MRKLAILLLKGVQSHFFALEGQKVHLHPVLLGVRHGGVCEYGFFAATLLTAKRLLRCAPWGKGGIRSSACKPQGKHEDVCVNAVSENQ